MAQQLRPSKSASKKPKIDWSRREEADNFAHTVKLYRQGKIDHDNFRRFRLQHGAYGTRMTDDYAMVRIKIPAGQIYPYQLEMLCVVHCREFVMMKNLMQHRMHLQLQDFFLEIH